MYAVATGLSMIPTSLVIIITTAIAADTKSMIPGNAIVRNLNSPEALGAVTGICSDKTGTLLYILPKNIAQARELLIALVSRGSRELLLFPLAQVKIV